MEANKILQADVLDIIFEGRNKDYGAYNLRKTYDRRVLTAFSMMIAMLAVLYAGYVFAGKSADADVQEYIVKDPHLIDLKDDVIEPPKLPPPPVIKQPMVAMTRFTPPVIVPDNAVKEDEKPPLNEALEDTKIGPVTQDGAKDDGIVAPPESDKGKGILVTPPKEKDDDATWIEVQIESQYPGGQGAWMRYLNKNFRYPEEAQNIDVQGTVTVQFIVDKDGNVSNVEAINGPSTGGLKEEAVRVIKNSGKWEPAIQNGRKVKSYKKQPIIFKLSAE